MSPVLSGPSPRACGSGGHPCHRRWQCVLGELGVEAHTAGGLLAAGTWPCPRGPGHRPYPRPSRPARPHVCSVPSFLLRVQGHQGWRGSRGAGNPAALRGAVSAVRLQQWLRTMRRKPFLGLASHQLHFLSLICSPQMAPPPNALSAGCSCDRHRVGWAVCPRQIRCTVSPRSLRPAAGT